LTRVETIVSENLPSEEACIYKEKKEEWGIHTLKNWPLYIVVCHLISETSQDESPTTGMYLQCFDDFLNVYFTLGFENNTIEFLKQFASNER
jgi:hypothetical protein